MPALVPPREYRAKTSKTARYSPSFEAHIRWRESVNNLSNRPLRGMSGHCHCLCSMHRVECVPSSGAATCPNDRVVLRPGIGRAPWRLASEALTLDWKPVKLSAH